MNEKKRQNGESKHTYTAFCVSNSNCLLALEDIKTDGIEKRRATERERERARKRANQLENLCIIEAKRDNEIISV